jgi:hypothetical protein
MILERGLYTLPYWTLLSLSYFSEDLQVDVMYLDQPPCIDCTHRF